jgi:hypothetical protein
MSGTTTVACGKCSRALNEPSDLPVDERQPCPICGSTARSFGVFIEDVVNVAAIATVVETRVESVPADGAPEAEVVRGRYRATLDWHALEGGFWLLHVVNESGEVVDGGVGDDPEAAPLEVYERLIPPA